MTGYIVRGIHSGKFLGVLTDWKKPRAVWVINRKDAVVFKDKAEATKVAGMWPSTEVVER